MALNKTIVRILAGVATIGAISYGLTLYAQQSGGLTPPPRPVGGSAGVAASPAAAAEGKPFAVGERLVFNVAWSSIPSAARLELEVSEKGQFFGTESYQLRTKVQTLNQAWSLFGEIDNQYTSYIHADTALPHRLVNTIHQGEKQGEEIVMVDQTRQQATYADESTLVLQPATFDLPSLVYALRLRPLPEGGRQKYSALFGKELIEVEAIVSDRERVVTQAGTFNTVCIKFYPRKKLSKYRAFLWLSDDARRLPVMIKATLPFGEVRADLISATMAAAPLAGSAKLKSLTDESGKLITNGKLMGGDYSLPFAIGERLNYEISWGNFISVGRASFEVRQQGMLENQRVFEFYGEATSTGAARTLINVNDQVSSFALVDRLTPIRTDLRLREGKRTKYDTAIFNLENRTARLNNGTVVQIPAGAFDLLSLYYAVRASNFKMGQAYNYPFLDANNRLQMVTIRAMKQETIGGPMGTRDAVQLDIMTPEPALGLLAQAWISNDARRLPLYFVTRTRFGELRFQMISAINTK